jgi:hypothetical protein
MKIRRGMLTPEIAVEALRQPRIVLVSASKW